VPVAAVLDAGTRPERWGFWPDDKMGHARLDGLIAPWAHIRFGRPSVRDCAGDPASVRLVGCAGPLDNQWPGWSCVLVRAARHVASIMPRWILPLLAVSVFTDSQAAYWAASLVRGNYGI